jgi:adenylate cyclase
VRRGVRFKLATSAVIAGTAAFLAWAGLASGVFFGTQLRLSDSMFPSGGADPRIVVVGIDDKSLAQQGRWPWDRRIHAALIGRLDAEGASLIGYDVTFSEPSQDPASDHALARALALRGNVVLAANAIFHGRAGDLLRASRVEPPIPVLARAAAGIGHSNVFPDADGVVRSLPPVVETRSGDLLGSLTFSLLQLEKGKGGPVTIRPDGFQIGPTLVSTGPAHLMDVNFADGYRVFSATDVLEGRTPPGAFRGKVVLVGASAVGLGDQKLTPLDKAEGQPGVLVHANALNTMLTATYLFPEGRGVTVLEVLLLALLVALAVAFLRMWLSPVALVALVVGFFLVAFNRFDSGHVMNLVYPPLAAALAYVAALALRYFTEVRERRRVTSVFGRYVAPDVVQEILESPQGAVATLSGASRPLAVLFSDLRGFTAASEDASPEDVVEALNIYLDAMVRAVLEEKGTIDKFMGDCVMAFWGAPRPDAQYAEHAVRAGLKMLDYIDEAIKEGPGAKLKVKGCGVGVSAGRAVVGNIGSADRLDFTAIGDTVNTASRLCGVAGAGEVVITEECADLLTDGMPVSELPPLVVKGKSHPLRVFQVLRAGQVAREIEPGELVSASEEKGHFEPRGTTPGAEVYVSVPSSADEGELEPAGVSSGVGADVVDIAAVERASERPTPAGVPPARTPAGEPGTEPE